MPFEREVQVTLGLPNGFFRMAFLWINELTMALLKEDCSLDIDRINQLPLEKKHNLNEEYLNSLTEEQRID